MRKLLCLMLTATLALPGCATARATDAPRCIRPTPGINTTGGRQSVDPRVMADYIRQLPVGSRVRLSRLKGDDIRGTLMKNDGDPLVIQRRARVPEAPIAVPLQNVLAVELDAPASGNPAPHDCDWRRRGGRRNAQRSLRPRRHLLGLTQT